MPETPEQKVETFPSPFEGPDAGDVVHRPIPPLTAEEREAAMKIMAQAKDDPEMREALRQEMIEIVGKIDRGDV